MFPKSEILPIANIVEYSSNARTHSADQIAQIAASIAQFGWTNPILVDERAELIAGHGRLAAARQLGMAEVPAIVIEGLSDDQRRALRLADNKLALNASWSDDLLRTELGELRDAGFDLGLTGWGPSELADMLDEPSFGAVGIEDQGRLDERAPVTCPECGHSFSPL